MYRTVSKLILIPIICACLNAAESIPSVTASPDSASPDSASPDNASPDSEVPAAIDDSPLPLLPAPAAFSFVLETELKSLQRARMFANCKVEPLTEVWDPEALAFEKNAESGLPNIDGLMPETAQALDEFRELVASVGGTFELKSAYRSPAYQAHLHEVWVKWVKQLRNNRSAGCRAMREEVEAEFKMHQLLVKQQPVPASDHMLGLAFDAAVTLPRSARLNRRRVSVDKLAAMAGIKRPEIRRDPVHFKLLPDRFPSFGKTEAPAVYSGD